MYQTIWPEPDWQLRSSTLDGLQKQIGESALKIGWNVLDSQLLLIVQEHRACWRAFSFAFDPRPQMRRLLELETNDVRHVDYPQL
jgi:hypothetical protein